MNRTWILLRTQALNFIPINELREPQNKKKNTAVVLVFGVLAVILLLCAYNIFIAKALVQAGEPELIPAYMVSVSSFAILFLTIFRSNGILFGSKDIDILASLPIKDTEIIGSKFLFMYLLNLLIDIIFMIPGGIIWIANVSPDILRFVLFLLSVFFVPLIPMCLASIIGILIVFVSSHFKNRNIISLLLSFAALAFIGYIAFSAMQKEQNMTSMGAMLAEQITGLYPLSKFFLKGSNGIVGISLFLILSIAAFFLFIKVAARKYSYFNSLASAASKYSSHRILLKRHSPFFSLYQKEFGRFFSSYMAVLNMGFGVILLCLFSILLLIMPPEQLGQYVGIEDMNSFFSNYAPIVIAAMLCLSCPSASSISLERKNIWILQSAPVSIKTILNSKIAVTITLHLLGYLLAVFAILIRLNITIWQIISLIFIPVCYSLFIAVLGIFLNKKYPNYDWNSEVMVVKQSVPVILTEISGIVFAAAPILLNWILLFPILPILWTMAGILLIAASFMYHKLCISNYI